MTNKSALPISFLVPVLAVIGCADPGVARTCLTGSTDCGDGICRDLKTDNANCGVCANACGGNQACSAGTCILDPNPLPACFVGGDPANAAVQWTICSATKTTAWISSTGTGGNYHAASICTALGYRAIGQFGGNCADVCSFCTAGSTCTAPGTQTFDGNGNCGTDALGQILCATVMWTCVI